MKKLCSFLLLALALVSQAQEGLPTDYLTPAFHAGRREALRAMMPANSVAVIFAYPTRTFSNDVTYPYHPSPDLYYFSGYKEPQAVLLIFKEPQKAPGGGTYKELFFVQQRDPKAEQWTGRRLGVEKVKSELKFDSVYNGSQFKDFPIDLSGFSQILFSGLPDDVHDDSSDPADLYDLIQAFKKKAALPENFDASIYELLGALSQRATPATLPLYIGFINQRRAASEKMRNDEWVTAFANIKDSAGLAAYREKFLTLKWNPYFYNKLVASLREIKTPEEMVLMRKTVSIS